MFLNFLLLSYGLNKKSILIAHDFVKNHRVTQFKKQILKAETLFYRIIVKFFLRRMDDIIKIK